MSESTEKKLDATGLFCPEPVFRTKIEIERMQVGQVLIVSADDPAAEDDISRWVTRNGHELLNLSKVILFLSCLERSGLVVGHLTFNVLSFHKIPTSSFFDL